MKYTGLKRHLVVLMTQVTCYSILISFAVYYIWLGLCVWLFGAHLPEMLYTIQPEDWLQLGVATLLSLLVAGLVASSFARKLVLPLDSLADSARKIAGGELSARAVTGDQRLTELSELVNDFNIMAGKLEAASGEIRTWHAAIAHELRTPVTILRGRLQGLADGIFPPEQALFQNLIRQTDGLARLIDDLRTLSLAESGYLSLRREEVDIGQEIVTLVELLRPAFAEKQLSLATRLDEVRLSCDAARIRQALLALLENARRYATPGIVLVSCASVAAGVEITVEDEGPGISEGIAEKLFDAFSRGENARTRDSGGSGLGLAVVKAITEAHNGQVSCEASELGGSCFRLQLPYIR
ncbi:ATP-binding protein [Kalamiella sp. sgz302252]|uniref:ATP-binding protein n=1 Tax=Pantoea sp. sgz302252 TaxID=3341827 RepID=UPI0036D21003